MIMQRQGQANRQGQYQESPEPGPHGLFLRMAGLRLRGGAIGRRGPLRLLRGLLGLGIAQGLQGLQAVVHRRQLHVDGGIGQAARDYLARECF